MKKTIILLLFLLCIPFNIYSQNENINKPALSFFIKTGYYIPAKESFRKNYDQYIAFGKIEFPMSLHVGTNYNLFSNTFFTLELSRIQNYLESNNFISISIMPAHLGLKYYFDNLSYLNINPYIGFSLGYYWAYFSIEKFPWNDQGMILGELDESQNYFGLGAKLSVGIDYKISNGSSLGLNFDYDYCKVGELNKGGLGNIGGLLISLIYNFQF